MNTYLKHLLLYPSKATLHTVSDANTWLALTFKRSLKKHGCISTIKGKSMFDFE